MAKKEVIMPQKTRPQIQDTYSIGLPIACEHWKEVDENGIEVEYCKGECHTCTCSGVLPQCDYPKHYKPIKIRRTECLS